MPLPRVEDSEDRVNDYLRKLLDEQRSLDTVNLIAKGEWELDDSCIFVELSVKDYAYESTSDNLYVWCGLTADESVTSNLGRVSGKVSKAERALLKQAIDSFRIQ